MRLEEEIKQTKFRSEYQKAALNLMFTSNWFTYKQKDFFSKFNITGQQYNVLRILRGQFPEAISTSDIKGRMLDRNSDTSRIVDRLAAKNLVKKKTCPGDKRLVDVTISDQGLQLLENIDPFSKEMDEFLSNLSHEEASELNRLLDKVRKE